MLCSIPLVPLLTGGGDSLQGKNVIDKLFGNDRVTKFDPENGQLQFGRVSINSMTLDVKIEWDDGYDEELQQNNSGQVELLNKIGIYDRRSVGYGSKVTDGHKTGTVREKRFLVTAALEGDPKRVLVDIPCELLVSSGYSKKGDKIVYDDEWLGLVVDTRAKVYFTMDKDGKTGKVGNDCYGSKFPHPGEKIKNMPISALWDAEWESSHWLWNFLYYLADPATITRTEIDCISIAWMGRIDGNGLEEGDKPPPNVIRSHDVDKVKFLYGRQWKYLTNYSTWLYTVRDSDLFIPFDKWAKELSEKTFFGLSDKSIDMGEVAGEQPIEIGDESESKLEPGSQVYLKVIMWRSVVDVDWDDGTSDTQPIFGIKPYGVINITPIEDLIAGDIVKDKREIKESSKYGYVVNIMNNGVVKVNWVTPPSRFGPRDQPQVKASEVSKFDIGLKTEYIYLRCFHNLPVVVPVQKNSMIDGVRTGVAVGIDVHQAKILIRCPDGVDRLVWAHNFKHYKGDVIEDICGQKWIPWNDPGYLFYSKGSIHPEESGGVGEEHEHGESRIKGDQADPVVLSMTPSEDVNSRPPFRYSDINPVDNIYSGDEFAPRAFAMKFQNALEREIECFNKDTPNGVWIEAYTCRADILTTFLRGPEGTPYEDHLLVFDIQLLQDFPLTPPDICFSSYDLTVSPCLAPDGTVNLPDSIKNKSEKDNCNKDEEEKSIILDIISHIRDRILVENPYYLAHPVEEATSDNAFAIEYNNFVILNMLEYTENVLKHPPNNWDAFIASYYSEALPRIISRHERLIDGTVNYEADTADTSTPKHHSAFILGLQSRLKKLRHFLPHTLSSEEIELNNN